MPYLTGTGFNLWVQLGRLDITTLVAKGKMECRFGLFVKRGMRIENGIYNGQVNEDLDRHGIGRWVHNMGWEIYEGEWKNDQRHGFGRSIKWAGSWYIGFWKNGKKHGYGSAIDKCDNVEEGKWINGELSL